jgi:CheY-like chemotaxis protein
MNASDLPHLFQRFAQVTKHHAIGGSGLGLVITKQLAQMMGGDVYVKSEPGIGSEFMVDLTCPLASLPSTFEAAPNVLPRVRTEFSGKAILVVDDLPANRLVWTAQLSEMGFTHVITASNGKEALEAVNREWPSFVILDLVMPVMDGVECARHLRSMPKGPDLPIIGVAASKFSSSVLKGLETLFDEVLAQPVSPEELQHAIEEYTTLAFSRVGPTRRILVVDDQPFIRRLILLELSKGSYEVELCSSGEEALGRLENESFDLVLLDRLMPGLDGIETASRIVARGLNHPPIILMSADLTAEDEIASKAVGVVGFLEKPVKLDAFSRIARSVLHDT